MMTPSAPIASRVSAVSLRLSPLDTLDPLAEKLMTSADSRLAATSNDVRVRVELAEVDGEDEVRIEAAARRTAAAL